MHAGRLLLCGVAFFLLLSLASALEFTGNTTSDFWDQPNVHVFYDSGNLITSTEALEGQITEPGANEITDVSWFGVNPAQTNRSGWDMRCILLQYDIKTDALHVGIQFYGVASDADGDGDASSTSEQLQQLGGIDHPNMTFSESIFLLIDPLHSNSSSGEIVRNFQPTWLLGKPPLDTNSTSVRASSIYIFMNMSSNGTFTEINTVVPNGIVSSISSVFPAFDSNHTSRTDFEFKVSNFSRLPGLRRDSVGALSFSFAVVAGSNDDGPIENDIIPNYLTTFDPPNGSARIEFVGLTAKFPCPSTLDPSGRCCEAADKDFCGVCFGDNKNMSICGVCFGATPRDGPSITCPATVKDTIELNFTLTLRLDPTRMILVESIGDLDGNGVDDIAVGVPGLPRGASSWSCAASNSSCALGAVYILLMEPSIDSVAISRVIIIDSNRTGINFSSNDLFGFSIHPIGLSENVLDLAIGAPGSNGSAGAVYLVAVDQTGLFRAIRRVTSDGVVATYSLGSNFETRVSSSSVLVVDAIPRSRNFGAHLGTAFFQSTRVMIISSPAYLTSPLMDISTWNMSAAGSAVPRGGLYLAPIGSGARVLGLRGILVEQNITSSLFMDRSVQLNATGPSFFGPSFAPLTSAGSMSAIAMTISYPSNRSMSNMMPIEDRLIIGHLSTSSIISSFSSLNISASLLVDTQKYNLTSNASLTDKGSFYRRGTIVQHLDPIGDIFGDGWSDLAVGLPLAADSLGAVRIINIPPLYPNATISNVTVHTITPGLAGLKISLPPRSRFGFSMSRYGGVSTLNPGLLVVTNPDDQAPRAFLIRLNVAPPFFSNSSTPLRPPGSSPMPFVFPPSSTVIYNGTREATNGTFAPRPSERPGPIRVEFLGNAPVLRISPATNQTSSAPWVTVRMIALEEISSSLAPVRSFLFPSRGTDYSSSVGDNAWIFSISAPLPGGPSASIDYTALLLLEEKVVAFNNEVLFRVDPNTVKFTLRVANWQFLNVTNSLVFRFVLESSDTVFITEDSFSPSERLTRFSFRTRSSELRISVPQFALVDGVTTSIPLTYNRLSSEFQLRIPSFKNFIEYDPDVSILDSSLSDPVSGSPSNQTLWRILIGVGAGLLSLVLLLAFICFIRRHRKNKQHEKRWRRAAELQHITEPSTKK